MCRKEEIVPMSSDDLDWDETETVNKDVQSDAAVEPEGRKLSRLERIKEKIRKMQGKDPDIYPMW